ncbi:MAG TPA: hypothetical protein VF373_14420 [Prolixibacteraceae bacterium]
MRKLAANYVVSEIGDFLKNGIVMAEEDGTVAGYIDTKGDLAEIEQLIFHNGILIAGFTFERKSIEIPLPETHHPIRSFVFQSSAGMNQFSIQNLIDLAKQVQEQFTELKIPEILNEISEVLLSNGGFVKENTPGIFLLIGTDLVGLHFTLKSRLKKIL